MLNRNLPLLIAAAKLLKPLLDELVFVGGCVTGVLITDPAAADVRPTYDIDALAEIGSYQEYSEFSVRLRALGFAEDQTDGAPICRWVHGKLVLDVMPTDEKILGFSNRWYHEAMKSAAQITLEKNLTIRVATAPYFLATKLEAFKGRGKNDYVASQDLEDLMAVIDGRSMLLKEVREASAELQEYISSEVGMLLKTLGDIRSIRERKPRMQWEQIGPKLRELSSKVSVIKVPADIQDRVADIVEELAQLLSDPRNRPA